MWKIWRFECSFANSLSVHLLVSTGHLCDNCNRFCQLSNRLNNLFTTMLNRYTHPCFSFIITFSFLITFVYYFSFEHFHSSLFIFYPHLHSLLICYLELSQIAGLNLEISNLTNMAKLYTLDSQHALMQQMLNMDSKIETIFH